jgi:hypothetical protein
MTKFDVQALKKHIADAIEILRDRRREVCDALNSSNSDRYHKYDEEVMALYVRTSILAGEIDMAERVLHLIKEQELEMSDDTLKEDS